MRLPLIAFWMLAMLLSAAPAAAEPPRSSTRAATPLDAGWKFVREDVFEAETAAFDTAKWRDVSLPQSFNGADGDDGGGYYRGPGWYRRTLTLRAPAAGRRIMLQFDGAALSTRVWVNGKPVGRHDGGHAAFRFDITDALKAGENSLAVRVDNTKSPAITPMGGDFTVFGGLYRRVWLIDAPALQIDLLDHGGPGVAVVASAITDASATIRATTRLRNLGEAAARAEIVTTIRDAQGTTVATTTQRAPIAAGAAREVASTLTVANPHRWDGRRDPYLHTVTTQLRVGGKTIDDVTVPLGIRSIAFDAARGFLLNGRPYPLRGVNLFHAGRPGRGLAATDDEIRADVRTFADMGSTSLRLVHFQHPEAAYDEADRLGLSLWTEIGVNGEIAPTPAFTANVEQQMRELVRQNVNHPSVVLWGIGNEVYSTEPAVAALLRRAQAVARAEDPTRPTAYAHCCQADDDPKALVSDVIGFNRYYGWYDEKTDELGKWAAGFHQAFPAKPYIVSEYGAGASILHQQDPPARHPTDGGFHPEQVQTRYHEVNWPLLRDAPALAGNYVWVGFDLASDGRDEGDRAGINDKGLVTYDRAVKKDAYFYYQAQWSDVPMLHLVGRRHDRRSEAAIEVRAYTNAGAATLRVNGREVGTATPDDHILRWPGVALEPGANVIEVRSAALTDTMTIERAAMPSLEER